MYTLTTEKKRAAIAALLEGNSVRSTERMTGIHRDTICRLLVATGEHCAELLDERLRNIRMRYIQADEIWCYVGKKDKRVRFDDPPEFGNQWVFVAMDAETKLVPSFIVGRRTRETTYALLDDLRSRLVDGLRFQLTTDGWQHYERAVEDLFGGTADFAQLIKIYGSSESLPGNERYSPSQIIEVISRVRDGRPDEAHICTSHIERQNLTMRMQLTNAFSKKLENLKAAVALRFAHYNLCRVHSSLRITPAMAAAVTSEIWELDRLLA